MDVFFFQLLRRLGSEGLNSVTEEHLLRMKEILIKLQRHKLAMDQNKQIWNDQGVIHLTAIKTRSVDLHSAEMIMKTMVYYAQMQFQQPPQLEPKNDDQSSANSIQMNPVF